MKAKIRKGAVMKLKIAIADDTESDLTQLKSAIDEAAEGMFEPEYLCFESGSGLLSSNEWYDVVFLDICMDGINGIETAELLRKKRADIPIIFVTSSDEYVWNSFSVHPFDYLLKSYDSGRIHKLFSDLIKIVGRKEPELDIKVARQDFSIPFSKIAYVTAQNHTVNIATDDNIYRSAVTFSYVKEELCKDPRFLMCNRGIIVNMDRVLRFDSDTIEMPDGTAFPVRQKDKTRLFSEFTQYQFRHIRNEV